MKRQLFSANASCVLRFTTARFALMVSLLVGMQVLAPSSAQAQQRYMTGEILVRYAPGVSENQKAEINRLHGVRIVTSSPGKAGGIQVNRSKR